MSTTGKTQGRVYYANTHIILRKIKKSWIINVFVRNIMSYVVQMFLSKWKSTYL